MAKPRPPTDPCNTVGSSVNFPLHHRLALYRGGNRRHSAELAVLRWDAELGRFVNWGKPKPGYLRAPTGQACGHTAKWK